jgi:S1-C subfamily serine protease
VCGLRGDRAPKSQAAHELRRQIRRRSPRAWARSPWLPVALALAALIVAAASFVRQQSAIDAARTADLHAKRIEFQLQAMERDSDRLAGRVRSTERELRVTPIAARVLKSVFTIFTDRKLGTAFVAWREDNATFLITANHVVDGYNGPVTLKRKGGSWDGEIVARDAKNDLALVRVDGRPGGSSPLWQRARRGKPKTGDQLLLVGSPYGLGGTVTTGIVSRVSSQVVQTDAAANPGNSGGPAVNRKGQVVGVLVAGGGENLNFAIRIERACAKLRHC